MTKQKTIYVTSGIILVLVLGWGLGWGLKKLTNNIPPTEVGEKFQFYPDSVEKVRWKTSTSDFIFSRKNQKSEWSPFVEPHVMQEKLSALSTLKYIPVKPLSSGLMIELTFKNQTTWQGFYDDNEFTWATGEKTGQGLLVDGDWSRLFEEGDWAFSSRKWNWCTAHPKKFELDNGQEEWSLYSNKGHWFKKTAQSQNPIEVDATHVEKWLERNCQISVTQYKDLDQYSLNHSTTNKVEFEFETGDKFVWQKKGTFWMVSKNLAIYSAHMDQAIKELSAL